MNFFSLLFFIFMETILIAEKAKSLKVEKIIGGNELVPREIRYHVSVQINYLHRCGGGIINKLFVLTAALCLMDEADGQLLHMHFSVLYSSNALYPDKDSRRRDVHKVYMHKSYTPNVTDGTSIYSTPADIAILEMTEIFDMEGENKIVILRAPANFRYQYKTFTLAGNGFHDYFSYIDIATGENKSYFIADGKLRYAEVHVITRKKCFDVYGKVFHYSKFCAEVTQLPDTKPRGVCAGDSGSPLVYLGNIIYGILLAGSPTCDETSSPAVYTRVSYYRGFIHSVLAGFNNIMIRVATLRRNADASGYEFVE